MLHILIFTLTAAKEREKAQKMAVPRSAAGSAGSSRAPTPGNVTPKKKTSINTNVNVNTSVSTIGSIKFSAPSTLIKGESMDQGELDISALGLDTKVKAMKVEEPPEEVPKASLTREKLLEEARRAAAGELADGKKAISIVVIGE
jgi:elongation factor 1 alpha-like protein